MPLFLLKGRETQFQGYSAYCVKEEYSELTETLLVAGGVLFLRESTTVIVFSVMYTDLLAG